MEQLLFQTSDSTARSFCPALIYDFTMEQQQSFWKSARSSCDACSWKGFERDGSGDKLHIMDWVCHSLCPKIGDPKNHGSSVFLLKLTISIHVSPRFLSYLSLPSSSNSISALGFPWKESFSFAAMLGDSLSSVVNCDFGDFGHSCWVETGQLQYAVFNAGNKKHCKFHQVSMRTLHSVSRESLDFVKSQEFGAGWLQHRAPLPFIPVTDIGWSLTPRSELSPTSGIGLGGQGWYSPQVIWPSTCSFFGRRFCSSDYANWLLVFMNLPYEIG